MSTKASPGSSQQTTDPEVIRRWAEERKAVPSTVEGTGSGPNDVGLLRFNFPGYAEENLREISWEQFFQKFREKNLVMLYQDRTADGSLSRFFKFISQESAQKSHSGQH